MLVQISVFAESATLQTVYSEDFLTCKIDKMPDEHWIVSKNSTDTIGAIMYQDARALKIAKGAAGDVGNTGTKLYLPNTVQGRAVVEANVMPLTTSINFAAMYVLDTDEKALVCCTFNNKGQIGVYYNGQWNYNAEYTAGAWYDLKADINLEAHTFSFYVNGNIIAENVGTRSTGGAAAVVNMYITTVNTTAYVNSVSVSGTSLAEPIALPEAEEEEEPEYIDFSGNVTVFEDDFESYAEGAYTESIGAWTVTSENVGTTEIVTLGDSKVAKISKPELCQKGMQTLVYEPDTATTIALGKSVVTVEYKIMSGNSQKFIGGPYIYSRTVTPAVSVGFSNQGYAYVNTSTSSIGSYLPEKWYSIRLVMDYPNKVFDVYVDGEPARTGEAFRSINSMDLKTVRFYVEAAGGACYVDDFKITTSEQNMPSPADEIAPLETVISEDKAVYTVTDSYVETRISLLPPVVVDTQGYDVEEFVIKSDAVSRLAKYSQDLTIRSDDMRIKIPYTIFAGLDNGSDAVFTVDKKYDSNTVWSKLSDTAALANTGTAVRIDVKSGGEAVEKLADSITVKLSECMSGDRDNRLVVIRANSDGTYENTISKHDLLADGIMFRTNLTGEFLAVRNRKAFSDVDSADWAKVYIDAAASRGIITGYENGSFVPEGAITRGELAVMLTKAIGLETADYDEMFEDMVGTEYSAPYAAALYYNEIIDREVFGDAFYPEKTASRTDIAYLVMNSYYYISGRDNEELTKFYVDGSLADMESVPENMQDYVKSAYVLDFINGRDGLFCPDDNVTRAEAARIITALLENVGYMDSGIDFRNSELTTLYTFPFTYKSYYTYIANSKLANMNENGAYGENVKYESGEATSWYIEEQRNIDDDIMPEIIRKRYLGNATGEPELVEKLMKAIEWGFSKQDETGGFDGSGDEYHSAFFFVEEAGRILLLMKESGDSAYNQYLEEYVPKLHKAASWLISDEEFLPYYKDKGYFDIYTHRYFYYGAALLYAYKLTGDTDIEHKAHFLILEGISRMTKEGILPEKYGFDIGYGVTSIHCAARCFFTCDDPMIRSELKELLRRSTEYIINKLDNKGNIDLSDSTRTGGQETKRDGVTVKTVSERSFYNTLLAMASISDAGDFVKARDQMAVRQAYLTPAYMEYKDSNYDLSKERIIADNADTTGNKNLNLTELPVKGFTVTQEYGKTSAPEAMFTDDDNTGGWYARKLPQYVDIDLGMTREIGKLDIVFGDTDTKKYTYSVMVSDDGSEWKYCAADLTTKPVTRNTAELAYTNARYVRIWIQQIEPLYQASWFTDIREVRIYGINRGEPLDFEPLNSGYMHPVEY